MVRGVSRVLENGGNIFEPPLERQGHWQFEGTFGIQDVLPAPIPGICEIADCWSLGQSSRVRLREGDSRSYHWGEATILPEAKASRSTAD